MTNSFETTQMIFPFVVSLGIAARSKREAIKPKAIIGMLTWTALSILGGATWNMCHQGDPLPTADLIGLTVFSAFWNSASVAVACWLCWAFKKSRKAE
jgi:hypothetical protein